MSNYIWNINSVEVILVEFTEKSCEDIAADVINNDAAELAKINARILDLESLQDRFLNNQYGIKDKVSKTAHGAVSDVIKEMYDKAHDIEMRMYDKILQIVECEKE